MDTHSTQGGNLSRDAAQWPTPNAHVIEHKSKPPIMDGTRKPSDPQISTADVAVHAFHWPTPAANWGGVDFVSKRMKEARGQTLSFTVAHSSHPAQPIQPGPQSSSNGPATPRRLNPIFGEWLMGWPSQWSKAEPSASSASATELYRSRLQQHLSCLLDGAES